MPPTIRPQASTLLALLLAAGCASLSQRGAPGNGSATVITNEPATPLGGPIAAQPAIDEAGNEVALGVARLVANDGRSSDVIDDDLTLLPLVCRSSTLGYRHNALAENGVYRSFDGRDALGSWVFVGIALGGDGMRSAYYEGSCGSEWTHRVLTRVGRLAPEVAGRDTSLLFTTTRRTVPSGGAAGTLLGTVIDRYIPRGNTDGNAGRTAKPRAAQPSESPARTVAPSPAPAAQAPAAQAPSAPAAPPAAPKASSDDRPAKGTGGGDIRTDGRTRPWGGG